MVKNIVKSEIWKWLKWSEHITLVYIIVQRCKRATPTQSIKYSTSSKVIKITGDCKSCALYDRLRRNFYEENRWPGHGILLWWVYLQNSETKYTKLHPLLPQDQRPLEWYSNQRQSY